MATKKKRPLWMDELQQQPTSGTPYANKGAEQTAQNTQTQRNVSAVTKLMQRGTGSQTTSTGRGVANGVDVLQRAQRQLRGAPYAQNAAAPAAPVGTVTTPTQRTELARFAEEQRRQSEKNAASALGNDKIGKDMQRELKERKEAEQVTFGDFLSDPLYAISAKAAPIGRDIEGAVRMLLNTDEYTEREKRRAKYNASLEAPQKADTGKALLGVLQQGIDEAGTGLTSTADFILGAPFRAAGVEDNPFHKLNEAARASQTATQGYYAKNMENASKAAKTAENIGVQAVAAVPDMVLAYLTAGGSTGAGALAKGGAQLAGKEAALAGAEAVSKRAGAAQLARQVAQSSTKNPMFWTSFARTTGNSYEQAKAQGASEWEASMYAIVNGVLNSQVEVRSGVQALPAELQKGGSAALAFLRSAMEEGNEEVVQGAVERALQNLTYGADNALVSATDENAIINPVTAAREWGMGAAVGGILGLPGSIVQGGRNMRSNPQEDMGERMADAERQRRAAEEAQQSRPRTGVETLMSASNALNAQNAAESPVTNAAAQQGNLTAEPQTFATERETGQIPRGTEEERVATPQAARNDTEAQTFAPEDHIDNRTDDYIRKTSTKAFQHEHPELHEHFAGIAQRIMEEAMVSIDRGSTHVTRKAGGGTRSYYDKGLKAVMERSGLSRNQVIKVCEDIINDQGSENYADAKRVEMALDALMSDELGEYGNAEYKRQKGEITGGTQTGSFDEYLDANWMRLMEGETRDQLFEEWKNGGDADLFAPSQPQENAAQTAPADANGLPDGQGAASAGFDPYSAWQNESDSFHREGEKAARPVELPTENRDGMRTMKGGQTVMEAEQTPTERADQLAGVYVDGGLAYQPVKNAELATNAESKIERHGWEKTLRDWTAEVRNGKMSDELMALGAVLINNAGNSGMDAKSYLDLASDYVVLTHRAGKALQASRILKNLTPSARLYMMQRSIYSIAEEAGIDDAQINPELAERFMQAQTDEERNAIIGEIQSDIASRLKSTAMDKWTALRYTNMLGNFKTQVRNLTGNTTMGLEAAIRRRLDAVLGGTAQVATGGKYKREVTAFYAPSLASASWSDFDKIKSYAKGESKYSDAGGAFQANEFLRGINDKKRVFGGVLTPLEWYRKVTQWAMEKGDDIFIRLTYADAMAQYLNAHGVKSGDAVRNGELSEDLLNEAREYAVREAQEATFHDTNQFSSWVSQIGRGKNTPKFMKTVVEGTLPFRKTPANVAVRGYEYSPLGVASSLLTTVNAIKPGSDVTANDAIRSWSKTMTGSALLVAGYTLARMGILRGKDDDDQEKAAFDHLRGHQEYSIEFNGKSYTIDAFAPSCMPLLVGAEAARLTADSGWDMKAVESALANLADPMINMSMLQGVNDTMDNIKFADNSLIQLAELSIFNYLTQGVTNTLAGQLERTAEPNRMTTYTDPDSPLPEWLQKQIGKASAKTPGWDYHQTEFLDAWGRTQSNGTPAQRAFRNLLAPWYTSEVRNDRVENELERLYDKTGNKSLLPEAYPPDEMSFDDRQRKATQSEKEKYQKSEGSSARHELNVLFKSSEYLKMRDNERAAAISAIYDFAKAKGKTAAGADYSVPSWTEKSDGSTAENAAFYGILQAAKQRLDEDEKGRTGAVLGAVLGRRPDGRDTVQDDGTIGSTTFGVMQQFLDEKQLGKVQSAIAGGYDPESIAAFWDAMNSLNRAKAKTRDWALQNGFTEAQFNELYGIFIK